MAYLTGPELDKLRAVIIPPNGRFTDRTKFEMFIDGLAVGQLPGFPEIDENGGFAEFTKRYLDEVEAKQAMPFLLRSLAELFQNDNIGMRSDLLDERLLDTWSLLKPGDVDGQTWFRSYTPGLAYDKSVKSGLFEYFAKCHPFSCEVWGEVSDRTKEQIEQSSHFVAIMTQDDVAARVSDQGAFVSAFEDWRKSVDEHGLRRKRFILLLFGPAAVSWWDKWRMRDDFATANSPFDDKSFFVLKVPDVSGDLAKEKDAINWFLTNPVPRGPFGVVVLGEPTAAAAAAAAPLDGFGLVAYLKKRNPVLVQYWQDGWAATKRLDPGNREQLFKSEPIFVRPTASKDATMGAIKGVLIPSLFSALGYRPDEFQTAKETAGKFKRVYWRPEGDWPDMISAEDGEYPLVGPLESIGATLLNLAGFKDIPGTTIRTRFEDLPADDPKRNLLSASLQGLREAAEQEEDDTVPVSLGILPESIRKFDRARLNIVAAHDQRVAPGDKQRTISHFEDWDAMIDRNLAAYFPGHEPKVLRIAVLFQNFDEFDGLRFAEGLTVRRWNLLKLRGGPGAWTFDDENVRYLKDTVDEMLQA
ncbi:hypothetical protein AB6802_17280 [Mesorhizobium sp. RCC_202]|uniref:hypothetical protein n=1 Tax=Mesorhizobium sp. RCC_202 TaxID=3239222 RepID=UPI0035244871